MAAPVGWSGEWEGTGVGTHGAALGSMTAAACGWQSTNKARLSRPPDHGQISIRKFRIVASVSNRIASNYSIRFEISNICTAL